jgi:hypothetical protein
MTGWAGRVGNGRLGATFVVVVFVVFALGQIGYGAEPPWVSNVIAPPAVRTTLESTPIVDRPYRPMHVYGNTVRRIHHRGRALPAPAEVRGAARVVLRRP